MNACIIYGIYAIILHDTWLFKNFWLLCSISSTRDTLHCWFSHALLQYFHFILSLLISFHLYMKIFTALNFDNLPFNFFFVYFNYIECPFMIFLSVIPFTCMSLCACVCKQMHHTRKSAAFTLAHTFFSF